MMKKMGFKLLGTALVLLATNAYATSQYQTVTTTSQGNDDVLTPGARLLQGLPGKNDFYILGRNEKTPTELTQQDASKVSAVITDKAANTVKGLQSNLNSPNNNEPVLGKKVKSYKVATTKPTKHGKSLQANKPHAGTKQVATMKSVRHQRVATAKSTHHPSKEFANRSHSKLGRAVVSVSKTI